MQLIREYKGSLNAAGGEGRNKLRICSTFDVI